MTAVPITIIRPADGATIVGVEAVKAVELTGRLGTLPPELAGVALFSRWYSSEFQATEGHYSLNENAVSDPGVPLSVTLTVGSQAITLGVSDQAGQDTAAQNGTRHGGVAGGMEGPKRCTVHVFRAVPRRLVAGATLSKAGSTLEADGPLHWPEKKYQAVNRLRYRWRFEPTPADGRRSADLVPAPGALMAAVADGRSIVRYAGPLPDLDLGGYAIRLSVEDLENPAVRDLGPAVPVVIVA